MYQWCTSILLTVSQCGGSTVELLLKAFSVFFPQHAVLQPCSKTAEQRLVSQLTHSWVWKLRSDCNLMHNCWQDVSIERYHETGQVAYKKLVASVMQLIIHIDVPKSSSEEVISLSWINLLILQEPFLLLGVCPIAGFVMKFILCVTRESSAEVPGCLNCLAQVSKQHSSVYGICAIGE